jgi:hypothetical protein
MNEVRSSAWRKRGLVLFVAVLTAAGSAHSVLEGCGGSGANGAVGLGGAGRSRRGAAQPSSPQAPGSTSAFPGAGSGPPAGAGSRTQNVPAALNSQADLRRYGIVVRGDVSEKDVQNVMEFARHYRPEETNGLVMTFVPQQSRRSSGVLGVWSSSGQSQVYSELLDVVFHEGTHHITKFGRNRRSVGIGNQVYRAAANQGGGRPPENTITRSYAQTNQAEFMAEFFTGLAALERGLRTRFTVRSNNFNPPEDVRTIARTIYANN